LPPRCGLRRLGFKSFSPRGVGLSPTLLQSKSRRQNQARREVVLRRTPPDPANRFISRALTEEVQFPGSQTSMRQTRLDTPRTRCWMFVGTPLPPGLPAGDCGNGFAYVAAARRTTRGLTTLLRQLRSVRQTSGRPHAFSVAAALANGCEKAARVEVHVAGRRSQTAGDCVTTALLSGASYELPGHARPRAHTGPGRGTAPPPPLPPSGPRQNPLCIVAWQLGAEPYSVGRDRDGYASRRGFQLYVTWISPSIGTCCSPSSPDSRNQFCVGLRGLHQGPVLKRCRITAADLGGPLNTCPKSLSPTNETIALLTRSTRTGGSRICPRRGSTQHHPVLAAHRVDTSCGSPITAPPAGPAADLVRDRTAHDSLRYGDERLRGGIPRCDGTAWVAPAPPERTDSRPAEVAERQPIGPRPDPKDGREGAIN